MPKNKHILIVWDDTPHFKQSVKNDCKDFHFTLAHDLEFVRSDTNFEHYDAIIVLLEPKLDNALRTDFKGLDIIEILRKEKKYKEKVMGKESE